jgi:UDP-N-acetylmuramoyl-L-alanyl-D-glutamate--2,6-diaminopimelate ligase
VIGYTLTDAQETGLARCLAARDVRATAQGLAFTIDSGAERADVEVTLVGQFNVSNLLAVTGALIATGMTLTQAAALLPRLVPPAGRMQRVGGAIDADQPLAVVDYAHTPDALAQALAALRPVAQARGGALWVVFGAGGDRDPGKRAPMGAAAGAADRIVVTSDNPRTEDPASIVAMVAAGVPAGRTCERMVDRAAAIALALAQADARDVVLIAGKGHEEYQDVRGVKLPFSDVEQAQAALAARPAVRQPLPPPTPAVQEGGGGALRAPQSGSQVDGRGVAC